MTEHTKVITCKCGETFESEDTFQKHKRTERREKFQAKAQSWIEDNLGEPFASYHKSLQCMGIDAYATCGEEGIPKEPTDENVRKACLAWARQSLYEGNAKELLREH